MRITKFGHACVRIEFDGTVLVVDPGVFTSPEAVDGADAVLITHEHPDHYLPDHLRRASDVPVYTIDAVASQIGQDAPDVAERTTVVRPGEELAPGGIPVTAVGELHAIIHPEMPRIHNSGFVLTLGDKRLYHPGDALTAPPVPVDLLFLPVSAPWARAHELVDFARAVKAPQNVAIHDRVYSEAGSGVFDMQANNFLPREGLEYVRLADGADLA